MPYLILRRGGARILCSAGTAAAAAAVVRQIVLLDNRCIYLDANDFYSLYEIDGLADMTVNSVQNHGCDEEVGGGVGSTTRISTALSML